MNGIHARIGGNSYVDGDNGTSSASSVHIQPDIFRLNIDCLHVLFEWLSLNELTAIALTCKRMHQAAGDYFRSNYVSKPIFSVGSKTIYMYPWRDLDMFLEYIPRISISSNNIECFRYIGENCKSIKRIKITGNLCEDRIECIKGVLGQVQTVDLVECPNRTEFNELFLKYCTNVTSLSVKRSYRVRNKAIIIGSSNEWLLLKYPTLRHFELTEVYELKQNELKRFFDQNPNVRSFSTDSYSLWDNRLCLLTSGVKLNQLAVDFIGDDLAEESINLLGKLYEVGFYKRLHVYSACLSQKYLNKLLLGPVSKSLEMIQEHIKRVNVPLLNVKALSFPHVYNVEVLETIHLPCNLPNLERIYFTDATTDGILPFLRESPKLTTIKIKRFLGGTHYINGFIDLATLNEEREQLNGAKKVTIYVNDNLFLLWKWTNKPMHSGLLELRRFYSHEWHQLNSNYRSNHLSDHSTF